MKDRQSAIVIAKPTLKDRPIHYDFSIKKPFRANKTIAELLETGYIGVASKLAGDNAFAAAAYKFKNKIKWTITKSNGDGERGLMTTDIEELDRLLQFMLDKFNWCPMIYSLEEPEEIFIFTPKNDTEKAAIEATISGEYGWQGSLYSLEMQEYQDNEVGFIFATKPPNSPTPEWLLVKLNLEDYTGSWSHHEATLKQVYYIWKEQIQLSEPNYNPTPDEILDALKD
jgi:hypothetical protein